MGFSSLINKEGLQVAGFLFTSGIGISFLVFLNASQPFVLRQVLQTPSKDIGRFSSILILCDELLALLAALVWGRLADSFSPRVVTAMANMLVALALLFFVRVDRVFPSLLLVRLLFSAGASGITTMLTSNLATISALHASRRSLRMLHHAEDQPLLGWARANPEPLSNERPAALSASLGISAGSGALLAVFVYLRIPIWLSPFLTGGDASSKQGLVIAFTIVAGLAVLNAVVAVVSLPCLQEDARLKSQKSGPPDHEGAVKTELAHILHGFRMAGHNTAIAMAYLSGFAARAQNIAVSALVPLWVASYYFNQGKCDPDARGQLKDSCHEAYAFASAVTGVIQLTALCSALLFIWVKRLKHVMGITSLLGSASFTLLGRHAISTKLGGNNPASISTWIASVGIGVAQTGATTLGLALLAKEGEIVGESKLEDSDAASEIGSHSSQNEDSDRSIFTNVEETNSPSTVSLGRFAGSLAGAYTFSGSLGILSITALTTLLQSVGARTESGFLYAAFVDLALAMFIWYSTAASH